MMRISRQAAPSALAALLALPLGAQQAQEPRPLDVNNELADILSTDQIAAASKRNQDVASAPADVVVLRSQELKALGYRTLGDALGGILGFRVNEDHAYQGLGAAGTYLLGDQNTRILVLLDGHALNSPAEVGSSKVGEDFGLPLELVDHVEVVRGPASSLYGNNAFQALVNVVSVAAAGERQPLAMAALTAGSGGLAELWAQHSLELNGVRATVMVSGFQRKGTARSYPELQEAELPADCDREERQSAYLHVRGGSWSFAGSVMSRVQRLASAPYGSLPGDPGNFYRNRRSYGEFRWEPSTDAMRWLIRAYGDRNEFSDAFRFDPASDVGYINLDQDPDRSLGLEVQGRALIGQRFSLTFGTERQLHRYSGWCGNPDPMSELRTELDYATGNTYLEGNWRPANTLDAVAGLQWAEWRPSRIRNLVAGEWSEAEKRSISRLTPRLSVIWKPAGGDVLKLIYGQGFRFPTVFERYYTDGSTSMANPGLEPEVISSLQLSWSRKWMPGFSTHLAASVFKAEKTIESGVDESSAMAVYLNAPQASKGRALEAEASWRSGGTELSGGLGWYRWERDGAALDNVASWNGVLKAIQHLGDWSLAGEARYLSGRENRADWLAAPVRLPANWTLRLSLRWEISHMWAQLSVEDLSNSRRRDLVAPEYQPISWMEGEGRSARLIVGARF